MSLATASPTDHPALQAASRIAATRAPRSRVAKSPSRQADKPAKLSFYLSPETAKRLGIASVMEGRSQSAIVEQLLAESLRRWVVSDRGGKSDDQATGVGSAEAA